MDIDLRKEGWTLEITIIVGLKRKKVMLREVREKGKRMQEMQSESKKIKVTKRIVHITNNLETRN